MAGRRARAARYAVPLVARRTSSPAVDNRRCPQPGELASARNAGPGTMPDMNPDCTITACSSAEAVAVAPYLLGFHPHDSLVVLGLVGHTIDFAVRYDLPSRVADFTEAAEVIARQSADRVILIGYGPPGRVTPMILEVGRALRAA